MKKTVTEKGEDELEVQVTKFSSHLCSLDGGDESHLALAYDGVAFLSLALNIPLIRNVKEATEANVEVRRRMQDIYAILIQLEGFMPNFGYKTFEDWVAFMEQATGEDEQES